VNLRIGFDMDGVLADFARAYHDVEVRLFGSAAPTRAGDPETEPADRPGAAMNEAESPEQPAGNDSPREAEVVARQLRRRHDAVWQAIRETPDFWTTLPPTEPEALRRIHEMMLRHAWEVVFITQRPATVGDTVRGRHDHRERAQTRDRHRAHHHRLSRRPRGSDQRPHPAHAARTNCRPCGMDLTSRIHHER
jgi:phosphoglycolate phosphatase-like HAD superfamily hydrolase